MKPAASLACAAVPATSTGGRSDPAFGWALSRTMGITTAKLTNSASTIPITEALARLAAAAGITGLTLGPGLPDTGPSVPAAGLPAVFPVAAGADPDADPDADPETDRDADPETGAPVGPGTGRLDCFAAVIPAFGVSLTLL